MAENEKPKWQRQIEEMLKEQFSDDETERVRQAAIILLDKIKQVERPQDEYWEAIKMILHAAMEGFDSLSMAYMGFQLGAAYEKFQNERRT